MGHHDDGLAVLAVQNLQELQDVVGGLAIEVAGGLVAEQQRGIGHDRPRDGDALFLTARQFPGRVLRPVCQPDDVERDGPALGTFPAAEVRQEERQLDVFLRRQHGQQVVELEHETDVSRAPFRQLVVRHRRELGAANPDRAARRAVEPAQQVQQRRLARARRAHDGEKIAVLTAYDYPFARLMDGEGIDVILVGDSAGSVVAGYDTTLPVTMDEMIYHTRAVVRGSEQAMIVADMPFLSYQTDLRDARLNAGRFIKEAGANAVKLEGGENAAAAIRAIVGMDVPVMAHIGLTPQSVHRMGGYKVQGREEAQACQLMADARAVEEAGAFAVVLEGIPAPLAKEITAALSIPTIGIGAGVHCDGQVLVIHDILGLCEKYSPKFVKKYADVSGTIRQGINSYIKEVKEGEFPTDEHSFK